MRSASTTSADGEFVAAAAPNWSRKQRRVLGAARRLTPAMIRGLGRSWRWELPGGVPEGAFTNPPRPAIYVFWHRCILPIAWFARDRGFGVLVSQHFDGELISQVAERLGYRLFRGSSTRGGQDALLAMTAALERGQPIALTVDGPRGPKFQAKGGAIRLAEATGAPIYALHASPRHAWTMRSWDQLQVPKPFTRLRGVWSGPLQVAAGASAEEMEGLRLRMQDMLNQLRHGSDFEPSESEERTKETR